MINSLLERHKRSPGAPILHEIQEGIGYVPDAIPCQLDGSQLLSFIRPRIQQ
jgi:hypothetical protein